MSAGDTVGPRLRRLAREAEAARRDFLAEHGERLEGYRRDISTAVQEAATRLRSEVAEISGGNRLCVELGGQAAEYADWLQWTFWDLPYFAVATAPEPAAFRSRVASCGLVYLAARVFDDVVDRHFWYKARRPTLLSIADQADTQSGAAEGLTLLCGVLLYTEGLLRLVEPGDAASRELAGVVLGRFRRVLVGAMMEHTPEHEWDGDSYARLVELKNVDYWRCLYAAVDPTSSSPLYPFLERYYQLAQLLNDVQDFPEDVRRGQPNLVALHLRGVFSTAGGNGSSDGDRDAGARRGGAVPAAVERDLAARFLDLHHAAAALPALERAIALLKLGESLGEARQAGLFPAPTRRAPKAAVAPVREELGLSWYSALDQVVDALGADALEEVPCPICGAGERRRLLEKQGFPLHRCLGCTHVYVTPRLRAEAQLRLAGSLDDEAADDSFLEVQRIFAEPICHLLRLRAPGTRLLDIGFGRGYVVQLARAYGFETFGLDSSSALVERLRPELGSRVQRAALGVDTIPWQELDVVVMSHVVEHLADPVPVLTDVCRRLRSDGILYVAVPDMGSLQFRIFGKHWDVINPLVHYQYFNQASMSRLLEACGFVDLEAIEYPPLPTELTPRWMRQMRRLGGTEAGELVMVARRGDDVVPLFGGVV